MTLPFDGLRPPRPAAHLRARVLAAAAAAAHEPPHWIDVLWESRRVRLALALGLLAALALNLPARSTAARALPAQTIEIEGIATLAERLAPPPLVLEEVR